MKIKYTRQEYDAENDSLLEKEGPFESDLERFLFEEIPRGCLTSSWFGVLPPYHELKEILEIGSIVNVNNVVFEWNPFSLSEKQFEEIISKVKTNPQWGIDIEFPPDGEEDWSHWALVRSLEKQKINDST
jgi:hypothetical protein